MSWLGRKPADPRVSEQSLSPPREQWLCAASLTGASVQMWFKDCLLGELVLAPVPHSDQLCGLCITGKPSLGTDFSRLSLLPYIVQGLTQMLEGLF